MRTELDEWRQAASTEARLRREFLARAEKAEAARDRLSDALQQIVDWVKDGCADDGYNYVMTEAQAALKDLRLIKSR